MNKKGKWFLAIFLIVTAAGFFLFAGGGMLLDRIPFPGKQDYARPPCEKLLSKETVEKAFSSRQDLVARLQDVGPGVKVEVATPCADQPEKALIRIWFKTKAEEEGISAILNKDSFKVHVEPVKY